MAKFRAEEGLSSIVHKLGHEISNYLTSIISFGAVISRVVEAGQAPDKKNSYYIDSIVDEAWRIALASERLVLLLSARMPHPVPCELRVSLAKVLSKLKKHYPAQVASLSIFYGRSSPVVMIEENQLQALLSELLQNAFSAGASGTPVEVLMEVSPAVGELTISNLAAPNPLPLDKLFEPFVTTRNSNRHIGLGLSVAWAIIERFNGSIELVEEDDGDKCRFQARVKLPTKASGTTAKQEQVPSAQSVGGSALETLQKMLPASFAVLVIEDEPTVASAIKKILELLIGPLTTLRCDCVSDRKAIELFEEGRKFDCVLCDLNLPGTTGQYIFEIVQHRYPEQVSAFAFLSGEESGNERKEYLSRPYLRKPFEPRQLIELLCEIVRSRSAANANNKQ